MVAPATPITPGWPAYPPGLLSNPWDAVESHIHHILSGASSSTNDSSTTSSQLPHNPPPAYEEECTESFLWEFWDIIAKFAGELPSYEAPSHERVLQLLQALCDLPNHPVDIDLEHGGRIQAWTELPLLGSTFREALTMEQGANFEAFLTRLTQEEIANWSWLGLVAYHAALEAERGPRTKQQGRQFDATIPRAKLWLENWARMIDEVNAEAEKDQGFVLTRAWEGPDGFSREVGLVDEKIRSLQSPTGK
ncbi:hypothetical protein NMY22_g2316 [Coprinellus aureogranulatus]|nr:hypothetical protein NMY22_g2316 [Coprinellus aureogranulatus]